MKIKNRGSDYMDIDYKEYYAEEIRLLRKAILNRKLIVFVGSGSSLGSGMPSWNEAIKQIAEKLNLPKDSNPNTQLINGDDDTCRAVL